ncbi:right-handed parallel beta-helix repeat-containing protein [Psychroserpens sp.]|uniref:right-handed parallel beta-helix repeat-containing protein n=1 Tax=Psychroserpens sp. TaxID=2020870 RepID=UPI001B2344F6|nr:right-handed parallel beta-helix repeat-containing protein [Psychroserpens sp.]MBO6606149.1 right-handed parallel beta-helix repeat-containing protein [Psychroserpens sp.]MBO6632688.1 right-handed parallel beta-helix repeat-containing protein [Psychroserpens sp.]
MSFVINAQQGFHVFPKNDPTNPGTKTGDGSMTNPWDLQTAFHNSDNNIKPGDTLWLHEGVYHGRYVSSLSGTKNDYITVSAYRNNRVTLNGNVKSDQNTVLEVKGDYVIYKNFEITWIGDFSRDQNDSMFEVCSGIRHLSGVNCKFYDLEIHDNPGLGIGSWRHGAGTVIENCRIYNNGFIAKNGKGRGEGIYVQNKSDEIRLLKNNVIFNNYYKGIEVWSAGKRAKSEYVKNIRLEGNIVFNSGSPAGRHYDNVIIASDDRNGLNVAKDITVVNNIFYHNTRQPNGNLIGDAPSLTIGFNRKAPVQNVVVKDNLITGGYNGLRLLYANSLTFKNNLVYTGIVQLNPELEQSHKGWNFENNSFYSKRTKLFRVRTIGDKSLEGWEEAYGLGRGSVLHSLSDFKPEPVIKIVQHTQNPQIFTMALFDETSTGVRVDFSEYDLVLGQAYKILDVENPNVIIKTGQLNADMQIFIPMDGSEFKTPMHNTKAKKTMSDFGVYRIEFESLEKIEVKAQQESKSFFKRLFGWLGF